MDAERRRDEAEALASMFGDEFLELSSNEWVLCCNGTATNGQLTILLPDDYPSCSPPRLTLDVPGHAGLREACQEFLVGFTPGEEFGLVVAQCFFNFCNSLEDRECGADSETATEALELAAVIEVKPDAARGLSLSLVSAGFKECGARLFVHGELGVVVEIREEVFHVSTDGIDAEDVVTWVTKQLDGDICGFGQDLLKWADSHRAAGESQYGSADGIVEQIDQPIAAGVTLTGNAAWKARLQAGETVEFRGGGNSLHPRIKSGECCRYVPVFKHDDIKEKDIVFCQIKGRFWGHMVKRKTFVGGRDEFEYTISNIHGWENGTCTLEHIYGKVIDH